MALIAALRLRGRVNVGPDAQKSMELLGLKKKNSLVVFKETPDVLGMMNKAKDFITFGPLKEKTLLKAYKAKKIDGPEKAVKTPKEQNPIRLGPPRRGFKGIKKPFRAGGSLGRRDEMDSLIERMI